MASKIFLINKVKYTTYQLRVEALKVSTDKTYTEKKIKQLVVNLYIFLKR